MICKDKARELYFVIRRLRTADRYLVLYADGEAASLQSATVGSDEFLGHNFEEALVSHPEIEADIIQLQKKLEDLRNKEGGKND